MNHSRWMPIYNHQSLLNPNFFSLSLSFPHHAAAYLPTADGRSSPSPPSSSQDDLAAARGAAPAPELTRDDDGTASSSGRATTAARCGRRRRSFEARSWGRDVGGVPELLRDDGAALVAAVVHHRAPTRRRWRGARLQAGTVARGGTRAVVPIGTIRHG